jgi:O-antigen/teichoic acid export membrane protein
LALGSEQVGALAWAQDLARWSRLPADYAARVGFPAFARLQADPAGLARAVRQALVFVGLLSGGLAAAGLVLAPLLVRPVFGAQWSGAVLPLMVFLAQTPLDALAAVLLPVVYALGRAGRGLRLSAAWVTLTWVLCAAALFAWPRLPAGLADYALAAIPAGYALSTFLALGLIVHGLPAEVRRPTTDYSTKDEGRKTK